MPAHPKPAPRTKKAPKRIRLKGQRRFPGRENKKALAAIRQMPCAICLYRGEKQKSRTEPEHWVTKGRGGYDLGDTFPTCGEDRVRRHTMGDPAFQAYAGQDLRALCDRVASVLREDVGGWMSGG